MSESDKVLYRERFLEKRELKNSVMLMSEEYFKKNPNGHGNEVISMLKEMLEKVEYSAEIEQIILADIVALYDETPNHLVELIKKEFPEVTMERIITLALK